MFVYASSKRSSTLKTELKSREVPILKVFMSPDIDKPVLDVLHSGYIGEGKKVKEFEAALKHEFKLPNVLTVNSCTSALQLALRLAGVGRGDEVLSTPATNMATNSVILAMGATPRWVDIDSKTGQVDPVRGLPHPTYGKVKALMVMDWGGVPCDYDALLQYCRRYGIKLIADSAHSLGAIYHDKFTGNFADFTCFSFQAVKHVTTGDGGALVCKDDKDHERGRLLRWFGIDRENPTKQSDLRCEAPIHEFGYKMHMNDIAATIGIENLKHWNYVTNVSRDNADYYREEIIKIAEEEGVSWLHPMFVPEGRLPTYWLYTIRVDKNRDKFADLLRSHGVACSKVHSRNDEHPCMPKSHLELQGVTDFYATQLSIPVGWWVTPEDREYVVQSIRKVVEEMK